MPVVSVHRYGAAGAAISLNGTQFIDGDLTIESAPATKPVVKLAQAIYATPQSYVLFQYGGMFSGSLSDLLVDVSALTLSDAYTLSHNIAKKQIIVDLWSKATNGTQFVDGDLTIAGPTTLVMSKAIFRGANTYTPFDVTGTITAGSLANLTVVPPSGLTIDPAQSPNPYIDGKQIKVKLI